MKHRKGFTLIELLIVIGIIAILAAIIFVAVDPARRFAEARDATRWSSVNSILNAYLQQVVDNRDHHANVTALLDGSNYLIGDGTGTGTLPACDVTLTGRVDMDFLVGEYIASLPIDPDPSAIYDIGDTGYYLSKSATNRITVGSCAPEQAAAISVSR